MDTEFLSDIDAMHLTPQDAHGAEIKFPNGVILKPDIEHGKVKALHAVDSHGASIEGFAISIAHPHGASVPRGCYYCVSDGKRLNCKSIPCWLLA